MFYRFCVVIKKWEKHELQQLIKEMDAVSLKAQ